MESTVKTVIAEPVEVTAKPAKAHRPFIPEEQQIVKMRKTCTMAGWAALAASVAFCGLGIFMPLWLKTITYAHVWLCMALFGFGIGFYRVFDWIATEVIK